MQWLTRRLAPEDRTDTVQGRLVLPFELRRRARFGAVRARSGWLLGRARARARCAFAFARRAFTRRARRARRAFTFSPPSTFPSMTPTSSLTRTSLLRLLQLSSAALPIGAF